MTFQYLHTREVYEDRYDVSTSRECLKTLEMINATGEKMKQEPKSRKYQK